MARQKSTAALTKKNGGTNTETKGTNYHPKRQIRLLFLSGEKYTARQINALANCNDARKCISELRAEGMNIQDAWVGKPRHKLYWKASADKPKSPTTNGD